MHEIEINWTEGAVSPAPPWILQYHREQKVPGGFSPVFWKLKKALERHLLRAMESLLQRSSSHFHEKNHCTIAPRKEVS